MDHVPPKLLFSPPYPPNLLTVPACHDCNAAFQKDDEYTRTVASLDFRASKQGDVRFNLPAIRRSLERPNAKAFADYLASQTTRTTVLAVDGMPMGFGVEVDQTRVNATGERIIRGLFFVETGNPLSPTARVKVGSKASVNPSDPVVLEMARIYSRCPERRDREIGKAFSYVAGFGSGFSVWLLMLYDYFAWVGTVDTRSIAD